ncbi:twin-arginine translocase subunit TatC [Egicoccus halophilus]|nr:twin-arginine translocase subunit TatC [Egicoccus halophilus]
MTRSPDAVAEGDTPGEMTLFEHLAELRTRLFRALLALAVGSIVGYVLFPWVLQGLVDPYCQALAVLRPEDSCNLIALRPLEPFSVRMKTAVVIGLFVGGPVIFYQLWRFITPGLTRTERRYALPFVILSQVMFALGIGFAYLVIPQGLRILLGIAGPDVETMLSANEYLSFFLTTSVAFGLVFELPLVLVFLSLVGILQSAQLRAWRPYAYVVILVAAAFITPTTDAVTLLLMAGPMILFYEFSIVAARLIERARRRRSRA